MGARAMHATELGHAWDARTKGSESLRLNNGLCTAPHILPQQLCIYIYSFAHIRALPLPPDKRVGRVGRGGKADDAPSSAFALLRTGAGVWTSSSLTRTTGSRGAEQAARPNAGSAAVLSVTAAKDGS